MCPSVVPQHRKANCTSREAADVKLMQQHTGQMYQIVANLAGRTDGREDALTHTYTFTG